MNNFQLDFLGIGTIKSGSSLLAAMIMQHPQVQWAIRKEVNYFNEFQANGEPNPYSNQPFSFYTQFFPDAHDPYVKTGEYSPIYITDSKAMHKIKSLFPDVKVIITLRNPVNRAYSHYLYARDFLQEIPSDITFQTALQNLPYLKNFSMYSSQLDLLKSLFPTSQYRVFIFEEMINKPIMTAQNTYQFIGVESNFTPIVSKVNPHKKIRHQWLEDIVTMISRLKPRSGSKLLHSFYNSPLYPVLFNLKHHIRDANTKKEKKQELNRDVYQNLLKEFEEDISRTEYLLHKKIPQWR